MIHAFMYLVAGTTLAQCHPYAVQTQGGINCGIGGYQPAFGRSINEAGTVGGYRYLCDGGDDGFVWPANGVLTPIPLPYDYVWFRVTDVADDGTAVGTVDLDGPKVIRGFTYANGKAALLPGIDVQNAAEVSAVNASGVIVGRAGYSQLRAVMWTEGKVEMLDLPLGPASIANDINDRNQICGWMGLSLSPEFGGSSPFLWQDGKTTTLPLPPSAIGNSGSAVAINNRGDAVGLYFVANSNPPPAPPLLQRACAWIDGQCIDLGTLPGFTRCRVQDINDAREIVGYCQTDGNESAPFIWRDGVMTDLRALAPPTPVGTTLRYAYAINDSGQITGEGFDLQPVTGHTVAFLLTPALPATPGDTNCDGHANVFDLLMVITNWSAGPVGGHPADVNRDNRVDVADLLAVITNWG